MVEDAFEKSKDGEILTARLSLEYLVHTLSRLEVLDSRDTIYALLSIAKDTRKKLALLNQKQTEERGPTLRLNYRKDYLEVYNDFTRFCIQSSGSLDVICRHWAHERDGDLPSWIPRSKEAPFGDAQEFKGRVHGESFVGIPGHRKYDASFGTQPDIISSEELLGHPPRERVFSAINSNSSHTRVSLSKKAQTWAQATLPVFSDLDSQSAEFLHSNLFRGIRITGIQIDSIMEISPRIVAGVIPKECSMVAGYNPSDHETFIELYALSESLRRILVADRDPNGQLPPNFYHEAFAEALTNINGNGDLDIDAFIAKSKSPLMTQYLQRVQNVTWNRRLARTKEGGLGLLPASAESSDRVAVLFGCSVPVLLRPRMEKDPVGSFTLIGECFIDGIMEGEAVAGLNTKPEALYFYIR